MKVRRVDFSPDEWLAGTRGMTFEQEGLYVRLCALIYSTGKHLPGDRSELAKRCFSDPRPFNRVFDELLTSGKVSPEVGGTFTIHRCEVELKSAEHRSEVSRNNISKRWKNKDIPDSTLSDPLHANHQPSTINHQPSKEKKDSRSSAAADGDFEVWWKEVPRKVGKGQARKAHRAALKKVGSDVLLAGIIAYAKARSGQEAQYTAHPSTWLTGERWADAEPDEEPMRSVPTGPPPRPEDIWPDLKTMGAAH